VAAEDVEGEVPHTTVIWALVSQREGLATVPTCSTWAVTAQPEYKEELGAVVGEPHQLLMSKEVAVASSGRLIIMYTVEVGAEEAEEDLPSAQLEQGVWAAGEMEEPVRQ